MHVWRQWQHLWRPWPATYGISSWHLPLQQPRHHHRLRLHHQLRRRSPLLLHLRKIFMWTSASAFWWRCHIGAALGRSSAAADTSFGTSNLMPRSTSLDVSAPIQPSGPPSGAVTDSFSRLRLGTGGILFVLLGGPRRGVIFGLGLQIPASLCS
jgi:hypothetical protein